MKIRRNGVKKKTTFFSFSVQVALKVLENVKIGSYVEEVSFG